MKSCYCRQLLALGLMAMAVTAVADVSLNRVTIDMVLQADGSAHVTEVWDVDADQMRYTELYQTRKPAAGGTISDFTVSEHGKPYAFSEMWNTHAVNKKGRCGIRRGNGGYELCWGIGGVGHHRYTLGYTITGLLRPDTEGLRLDMVLFRAGNLQPQSVSATISRADGALADDDVLSFEPSETGTEASFTGGRFVLATRGPMAKGDCLGARIVLAAKAFDEFDFSAIVSTNISPDELTSPMMRGSDPSQYDESWIDRCIDFYYEWPLLSLLGILGILVALFYVIRKLIIALL